MMSDEQLLDLWDICSDFVDVKQKQDLATKFVHWAVDNGVEEQTLYQAGDQDPYLLEAVNEVYGDEHMEDESEYDEYDDHERDDW